MREDVFYARRHESNLARTSQNLPLISNCCCCRQQATCMSRKHGRRGGRGRGRTADGHGRERDRDRHRGEHRRGRSNPGDPLHNRSRRTEEEHRSTARQDVGVRPIPQGQSRTESTSKHVRNEPGRRGDAVADYSQRSGGRRGRHHRSRSRSLRSKREASVKKASVAVYTRPSISKVDPDEPRSPVAAPEVVVRAEASEEYDLLASIDEGFRASLNFLHRLSVCKERAHFEDVIGERVGLRAPFDVYSPVAKTGIPEKKTSCGAARVSSAEAPRSCTAADLAEGAEASASTASKAEEEPDYGERSSSSGESYENEDEDSESE